MPPEIHRMPVPLPLKLGHVNSYLITTDSSFILIDTGSRSGRETLFQELDSTGCKPGKLSLILLTHGDFDHTGNALAVHQIFGGKIGMHPGDFGMLENGDMTFNRKKSNFLRKAIVPPLIRFTRRDRGKPDVALEEGFALSDYGWDAGIVEIPGHSRGSIGILTSEGDLFCGDLLDNYQKPGLSSIMDDPATAAKSLEKLKGYPIRTVYPGHGEPFDFQRLIK